MGRKRRILRGPTVKIRIPPREVEEEVDEEGAGAEEEMEKRVENEVEQAKITACGKRRR